MPTAAVWVVLLVVLLDLFSLNVTGWSLQHSLATELVSKSISPPIGFEVGLRH